MSEKYPRYAVELWRQDEEGGAWTLEREFTQSLVTHETRPQEEP